VLAAEEAKLNDAMEIEPEVRINAINKEIRGLFNRRAFPLVQVYAVHSHANIIGTRINTRLKHFGTIYEEAKARLIIHGCQDAEKNRIVFNAPTVSHASICILTSFAAIKDYPLWTKDTTQALLQSKDTFSRDLYAMLPLELRSVFKGYVLKMLKPWYGTQEARTYLIAGYSGYWKQKVGVTPSTLDPCFMTATCNQAKDAPHGIADILVDDTLMTGNMQFSIAEERMHSNYDMGQTQTVTNGSQIKFGGVQIGRDPDGTLRISQEAYIENLSNIKADLHNNIASAPTARGKVSWIATRTRPDAAFAMGKLSQITPENINSEATKSCNDLNDSLKKAVKRNPIFCKLDVTSPHVVFYSDASFAGNLDLSSQIGGIILLKVKHGNAHVLHWFSKKCPRVTGSVLAAEIIGFVTAFVMASALRDVLEEIYQQSIPLYGLTDSYSFLFHGHATQCVVREASIDRGRFCTRGLREVRACQSRFCENGVQPGRPYDKICQKHAFRHAPRHGSGRPSRRRVRHARADDP
jgi:hypothetical protein